MAEYQYREYFDNGVGSYGWGKWKDLEELFHGNLHTVRAGFAEDEGIEIRIKPEFEPGWFQAGHYKYGITRESGLQIAWFESQKAIDDSAWTWNRVNVTPAE